MTEKTEDDFDERIDSYEHISLSDYITRYGSSEAELRDLISFLIHRRELLRDCEIEQLENECEKLIEKLSSMDGDVCLEDIGEESEDLLDKLTKTKRAMLLEELDCFKDILRLQRRLIEALDKADN